MPCIGVDLMGSDASPLLVIEGVKTNLHLLPSSLSFRFFLNSQFSSSIFIDHPQISYVWSGVDIVMKDEPLVALKKKTSSLCLALKELKEQKIDALLTAGNTSALVAWSSLLLKSIFSSRRFALAAQLPHPKTKTSIMLDVGANLELSSEDLFKFGLMGAKFYHSCYASQPVKVGLLNIGVEAYKGGKILKKAYRLFESDSRLRQSYTFIGNIEPSDLWETEVHVVVSDAVMGNIFIKTAEGVLKLLRQDVERRFYGALLLGLPQPIMKIHGNSDSAGFNQGLLELVGHLKSRFFQSYL